MNECFYEKVYKHPWLKRIFKNTDQEHITAQQTKFMTAALGGAKLYSGRLAGNAHPHIFINEEIFALRSDLLQEAFVEMRAPEILVSAWLRIDNSFKSVLLKKTFADCEKRYFTDEVMYFPRA